MSVVPPGANGTTIFTGLLGQALCAKAGIATKKVAATPRATWASALKAPDFAAMA
jgi:hypothetical protein